MQKLNVIFSDEDRNAETIEKVLTKLKKDGYVMSCEDHAYLDALIENRQSHIDVEDDDVIYTTRYPDALHFISAQELLEGANIWNGFIFKSEDPILWEAFVEKVRDYYGIYEFYNSDVVGMDGYACIAKLFSSESISRTMRVDSPILTVKSFADLDKIGKYKPKKVVPELPEIHEYSGKYQKNSHVVTYGCAEIDVTLLRSAQFFQESLKEMPLVGNRSDHGIVLSSGKQLTWDNINKILLHVDAVNSDQENLS